MTAAATFDTPPVSRLAGFRFGAGPLGAAILILIAVPCIVTLPWSLDRYDDQRLGAQGDDPRRPPTLAEPFGTDQLGRSIFWRCLLGGAISLGIGASAALIAVFTGVVWGAVSGYTGGRTDAAMMRTVDVLYGLPYVLLVVILGVAFEPQVTDLVKRLGNFTVGPDGWLTREAGTVANVLTLLAAIGGVSWLTMARVIRGQVLSLRAQPFVEAARACGVGPAGMMTRHLLPNLLGPIIVYATLTVPSAILQESFLSFLGIGVRPPLPSWGNLAAEAMAELSVFGQAASIDGSATGQGGAQFKWWLLFWPCALLGLTLMALNFLGDALRERFDPRGRRSR